jgi:hypothetical protein
MKHMDPFDAIPYVDWFADPLRRHPKNQRYFTGDAVLHLKAAGNPR